MQPKHVHDALWACGKLAEGGVRVEPAAVKALTSHAPRAAETSKRRRARRSARNLTAADVSNILWAWQKLADKGVNVDPSILQEVRAKL